MGDEILIPCSDWNTRSLQEALDHLRANDSPVLKNEAVSPILAAHINLQGSYQPDLQAPKKRKEHVRPLQMTPPLF